MKPEEPRRLIRSAVVALLAFSAACRTAAPPAPRGPIFFPAPPDPPRIQYFRAYSTLRDIRPKRFAWIDFLVGPAEPELSAFAKPYGLDVTRGKFYVCDTIAATVWVVNFISGDFRRIAGDQRLGRLRKPINITIDGDGNKYVADIDRGQVVVYGPNDEFLHAFGENLKPADVATSGDLLIVGDLSKPEILVMDKHTGNVVRRFGSPDTTPPDEAVGQPTNLALDSKGNIVVSDTGRYRIITYAPDGTFLGAFGRSGRRAGEFARPKGIAIDHDDRIYVVDAAFENVQMFDEAHRLLMWFGGHGSDEGALSLPAAVRIDYENVEYFRQYAAPGYALEFLIWVTNQTGPRKVCCFGFVKPATAGETPK